MARRPSAVAWVWQTGPVRVYLGSDHAGFELKTRLIEWLAGAGHEPVDCGPEAYVADDDYPPHVMRAAHGVASEPGTLGIVIGGSGNG
jgi:ribose 5-phosphate isomerase B